MIIRKPNLKNMDKKFPLIPKDFAEVMRFFNKSLKENKFPYIPRKNPITVEEIKNLWIPSIKKNITILAEKNNKIIGSITVIYDQKSNLFNKSTKRERGHIGMAIDPKENYIKIGTALIKELKKHLKKTKRKAIEHLDVNFKKGNLVMQKSGIKGQKVFSKRYKYAGYSGKVFEYLLP